MEEHALAEAEVVLTNPSTPSWLKCHNTSTTAVYQRTGITDPKDPMNCQRFFSILEKLSPQTVQMKKGSLLRRSGVSLRSAVEESQIASKVEKGPE